MDNGIELKKFCFVMKWERRLTKIFAKFPHEIREQYAPEFNHYLTSNDHGLPHAANVYGKVLEILDLFSAEEIREMDIDIERLEATCIFHDAGRFLVPSDSDTDDVLHKKHLKRKRKGQTLHEYAGALLAKVFGYSHIKIREGILRHDYFNADFDKRTKPPVSIEAQILRAADKTSVAPADEIARYDEYRRKFNFPLFKRDTPIEFRLDWNFSLKRDPRTDQLCYFFAVLALRPEDFTHLVLQEYYRDWSCAKKDAIRKIVEIVRKDQGDGAADIVDCQIVTYLNRRGIVL